MPNGANPIADPILSAFCRLAENEPDRTLVLSATSACSAGEIGNLARGLAAELLAGGIEPGMLVGLRTANGPAFLAALLALRRCRAAAVLLAPSEGHTARPPEHDEVQLEIGRSMGAAFLLAAPPWARRPSAFRLEAISSPGQDPTRVEEDVAVVKVTSGTISEPRGIPTPSSALVADHDQLALTMELGSEERILAAVPMSHSYGLSSVAMPALLRGSTLVVPDGTDPFGGLRLARNSEITFLPTSPAYLAALVRTAAAPPLPASLRRVISAGAPLSPRTASAFRRRFGQPVHVFYGASECGGICYDREGNAAENGTVGTPVEGVRVSITPIPENDAGLLAVESAAVGRTYLPEADSRLGQGRFRSNDLARWRGREVELAGRIDDLVNLRGRNVNPREVENVLRAHPAVDEAAVLRVQDAAGGDRLRAIAACAGETVAREELLVWCRKHLAAFKVPRSLLVVDRFPQTERGKPDRAALRRLATNAASPPVRVLP